MAGRWRHVAVVLDGYAGEVLVYVDGIPMGRFDDYLLNGDGDLRRMADRLESIRFEGLSFVGALDELEPYDYARSKARIEAAARRP